MMNDNLLKFYEEYWNDIIEAEIAALERKMKQHDEIIAELKKMGNALEIISKTLTKHKPPEVILPRDQYPTKSSR